jgi:hypothetical protein
VSGADTPDEILVNIHPERLVDLLRDSKSAEAWVVLFDFNNRLDGLGRRAFASGFSFLPDEYSSRYVCHRSRL